MPEVREQYIWNEKNRSWDVFVYSLWERVSYTQRSYFNHEFKTKRIQNELTWTIGFCEVVIWSIMSLPLLRWVQFMQWIEHAVGMWERFYAVTTLNEIAIEPDYQWQWFADQLLTEVEERSKVKWIDVIVAKRANAWKYIQNLLLRNWFTQIDSSSNRFKVIS